MSIHTLVGSPGNFAGGGAPKVYYSNVVDSAVAIVVAAANPSRSWIQFINPGTVDILVFPSLAFASVSATSPTALAATFAARAGAYYCPANGGSVSIWGQAGEFKAIAASGGATNPLTIMDTVNQAGSPGR